MNVTLVGAFALFSMAAGQIQRSAPNASLVSPSHLTIQDARCSTSKNTAFIPFSVGFNCQHNGTLNGCYAQFGVNLLATVPNPNVPRGKLRRFMCMNDAKAVVIPIADIEGEIGGIEVSVESGVIGFSELHFDVYVSSFDPATMMANVVVHANWRDAPQTMVDVFDVVVHGELIWTTNLASALVRSSTACSGPGVDSCEAASYHYWSAPLEFGGTALGGFTAKSLSNTGHDITRLEVYLDDTFGDYQARVSGGCVVGDAPGVHCSNRMLSIRGSATELSLYRPGVATHVNQQRSSSSVSGVGNPGRPNRCGMRRFSATTRTPLSPYPLGALAVGVNNLDCGYAPYNSFSALATWDWRWAPTSLYPSYSMSLELEATALH